MNGIGCFRRAWLWGFCLTVGLTFGPAAGTAHATQVPSIEELAPWLVGDWVPGLDYDPETYNATDRQYFYNSPMALDPGALLFDSSTPDGEPKLYGAPYRLRNYRTDFEGEAPGVPGPFEKSGETGGYDYWGGDAERGWGKNFYPVLIEDFGTLHISAIHEKIHIKRQNPKAATPEQDRLLKHLLYGSTQIFNWYAQLVDDEGTRIPYDPTGSPSGQLRALFDLLINGAGTPDGVLDPEVVLGAFQSFADMARPGQGKNAVQDEVDRVRAFVTDILRLETDNPIQLLSWFKTLEAHQIGMFETYEKYREYYLHPTQENREAANMHSRQMLDGGRQLAAFFGIFYSGTAIMDAFLDEVLQDPSDSVFEGQRAFRVRAMHSILKRYWYEHVHMFDDFGKAAALNDTDALYKIKISQFESCSILGVVIGAVFKDFDTLIRRNQLLDKLDKALMQQP